MQVQLSHSSNPDIAGGYWEEPIDGGKKRLVEIQSYDEASKVCNAFIQRNQLGAGNWTRGAGAIFVDGKQVAVVSYNGRVWPGTKWVSGAKPLDTMEII